MSRPDDFRENHPGHQHSDREIDDEGGGQAFFWRARRRRHVHILMRRFLRCFVGFLHIHYGTS